MIDLDVLHILHRVLAPRSYLEIGAWPGESLRLSRAATILIDPAPPPPAPVLHQAASLTLFQTTNEQFFARSDLATVFQGRKPELALIDGEPSFASVLHDIDRVDRWSARHAVIAVRNVIPAMPMGSREEINPVADTWRIVPFLRQTRSDLVLEVIDVWPAGLLLIRQGAPDRHELPPEFDHGQPAGHASQDQAEDARSYFRDHPPLTADQWFRSFRAQPV